MIHLEWVSSEQLSELVMSDMKPLYVGCMTVVRSSEPKRAEDLNFSIVYSNWKSYLGYTSPYVVDELNQL